MQILIINGSPKGSNSVTLKTAQYLEQQFPEHKFTYLHAGAEIQALEKNFTKAKTMIEEADVVIFAYPVYTFLAPAQLHRFIELMYENGVDLAGKSATQLTTSRHFFDTTAHAFINSNLQDLGGAVYEGLSADMGDLLTAYGRKAAAGFFDTLLFQIDRGMSLAHEHSKQPHVHTYERAAAPVTEKSNAYEIALITCMTPQDTALEAMIADFEAFFPYAIKRVNVYDFPFKGGCLGCMQCSFDGQCVYTDGFQELLREQIDTCDGSVYAFPIRNHFTYSQLKMFNDRQFCNGHRTVTAGAPIGYMIDGNLLVEPNLRTLLEARASVGGNFYAGAATDEGSQEETKQAIENLAAMMTRALENELQPQENFYGAGGMRIFRDLVYQMQGIMKADHAYFKSHGLYDSFPQNHKKSIRSAKIVGHLLNLPKIGKQIRPKMTEYMLKPYVEVLDNGSREEPQR